MNDRYNNERLNRILRALSDEIDVPPSKYQEAKDHYDAVGEWLGEADSELRTHDPTIYPQGSFALGTAVRPLGDDGYDVDAVCLMQKPPRAVTQQQLKAMVGDRLRHPQSRYKHMIEPPEGGRRCWTIQYADASSFHLDVLPAVPDDFGWLIELGVPAEWAESAICLTDMKTWDIDPEWPRSNPKGYVNWFKHRMRSRLDEAKQALAMEKQADVESIEDFEVRTPLQRLIQILKRHRDVRYNGNDDKPISIIITTLAAEAYDSEGALPEALLNVVPRMRGAVEQRDGVWWVANPVNPKENFADKWLEHPKRAQTFIEWLSALEQEYLDLLRVDGLEKVGHYLRKAFGSRDANAALAKGAGSETLREDAAVVAPSVLVPRKSERPTMPRIELAPKPGKPWRP